MTDRERIALAEEAESLPIHVRMCALRHSQIMDKIDDLEAKQSARLSDIEGAINAVKKAAWGLLATVATGGAVTLAQLAPIMRAMAGQ
jgi:hypothetical protein